MASRRPSASICDSVSPGAVGQHEITAEGQFRDVEFGMAKGAKERLLDGQRKEGRLAALDSDTAVNQRSRPVIVPAGNRQREFHPDLQGLSDASSLRKRL